MTLVHVSAVPVQDTGVIHLTVSVSGVAVEAVTVFRRLVGDTTLTPVIAPAPYLDVDGSIRPISGQCVFDDTTAPLDVAVEYLAAPFGDTPILASSQVTLTNPTGWWLGDPLRPQLNVQLSMRKPMVPCSGTRAVFFLRLGEEQRGARSTLVPLDGRADDHHTDQPMALPAGSLSLATRELADLTAVHALLDPGGMLLLRAPGASGYGLTNLFVSVREATTSRLVSNHRDPSRRVVLDFEVELQPAGGSYGVAGSAWGDLCDGPYATLAAATAAGVSWSTLVWGVAGGTFPAAWRTWDDVDTTWATWAALTATGKTWFQLTSGA